MKILLLLPEPISYLYMYILKHKAKVSITSALVYLQKYAYTHISMCTYTHVQKLYPQTCISI